MKFLHVIDSLDPAKGGPVASVRQIASVMAQRGHVVEIATLSDRESDPWIRDTPQMVWCFGPARLNYSYAPRFRPWLRDNARNYDLVVVRGLWQYQSVATASEMSALRRPYAIHIDGMLGPFGKNQRLKYLKKLAYWATVERRCVSRAAAAIFTNDEEERLARGFLPCSRWNPMVISHSVDSLAPASADGISDFLARFPEMRGKTIVLYLGRLHPIKGCDILIRAFARAFRADEEVHLVLAGPAVDVGYHARIRRLAEACGMARRITWPGMVAGRDKSALFSLASVFVSPSHGENFGISAVEALAFGLPVILTNKVNIHSVLGASGAALICEDTEEGLAQSLRKWRALGADERGALRERQLAVWKEHFSRDSVGPRLDRIYSHLGTPGLVMSQAMRVAFAGGGAVIVRD